MIGLLLKLGGWVRGNPVTAALAGVIIALSLSIIVTSMRLKSARAHLTTMTAQRDAEAANHRATKATYARAQAEAKLEHEAVKLAVELQWKDVAHETEHSARAELDRARDDARRMLADRAARAGAGCALSRAQLAGAPQSTAAAGGASALPQLDDDVLICTENTVKARSWQAFYEGLGATR